METIKDKKSALENGFTEISEGVYLATSDYMTSEQASWDDEDENKDTDFSTAQFWITTDSGHCEPVV